VSRVLVDAGPLVAFLRQSEAEHEWALAKFKELRAPYLTCEPVLAEAFFLVSVHPVGVRRFFDLLNSGLLEIDFSVLREREALWKLIHKYEDLSMSLADACIVRLAELHARLAFSGLSQTRQAADSRHYALKRGWDHLEARTASAPLSRAAPGAWAGSNGRNATFFAMFRCGAGRAP